MTRLPSAVLLFAALAGPALAQAPRPAPPAARPVTAPDPTFEAAKAAFEALPEDERRRMQDALSWVGDYNSVVSGAFGRRTFEALQAWQGRFGGPGTGILDDRARAALIASGDAARKAVGFAVKDDPATGIRLGVPERLLPKHGRAPGGSRWQSADGRVTLDSKDFPPGETDLDALFERATLATPERKVTYKLRRPDFIVATGETPTGKFYIRYAAGTEGVRGFTLAYDKALARDLDRLVIAVANSFVPFPAQTAPMAASGAAPVAAAPPAAVIPAGPGPGTSSTGLVVAPGRVLTTAAGACAAPVVAGAPGRVLRQEGGLALIEVAGASPRGAMPALAPSAPEADEAVVVVAAGSTGGLEVAPGATGAGGALVAPLQPGAAGAPVLDRSGRLVGLVARLPASPRLVAGVMPAMPHPMVEAATLRRFLGADAPAAQAAGAEPRSAGSLAAALAGRVVAVRCRP
ncbi:MAG: peptidoglycan-binding domain-containing protein [Methylobacterium frigidaeris]